MQTSGKPCREKAGARALGCLYVEMKSQPVIARSDSDEDSMGVDSDQV
jgi:hypothetical protein